MKDKLDLPLAAHQLRSRTLHVCENYHLRTLRDVKEFGVDELRNRARGCGDMMRDELKQAIEDAEQPQPGLFEDPTYIRQKTEDGLTHIQALVQDVERKIMLAALKGQISPEQRSDVTKKLRFAADAAIKLPCKGD